MSVPSFVVNLGLSYHQVNSHTTLRHCHTWLIRIFLHIARHTAVSGLPPPLFDIIQEITFIH